MLVHGFPFRLLNWSADKTASETFTETGTLSTPKSFQHPLRRCSAPHSPKSGASHFPAVATRSVTEPRWMRIPDPSPGFRADDVQVASACKRPSRSLAVGLLKSRAGLGSVASPARLTRQSKKVAVHGDVLNLVGSMSCKRHQGDVSTKTRKWQSSWCWFFKCTWRARSNPGACPGKSSFARRVVRTVIMGRRGGGGGWYGGAWGLTAQSPGSDVGSTVGCRTCLNPKP